MSAILIKDGDNYNSSAHHEYQLLSESDVSSLPGLGPCAVGSQAYTFLGNKVFHAWVLCEDGIWKQVK